MLFRVAHNVLKFFAINKPDNLGGLFHFVSGRESLFCANVNLAKKAELVLVVLGNLISCLAEIGCLQEVIVLLSIVKQNQHVFVVGHLLRPVLICEVEHTFVLELLLLKLLLCSLLSERK